MNDFRKILFFLLFIPISLYSQVSVSPYSMFGSGIIEDDGHGNTRLTGGTGLAFLSDRWLNSSNPASYSAIDSLTFMFETGFYGKYSVFKMGKEEQPMTDGKINYFSFGFKINKFWSMAFGIVPYSSVNYTINSYDVISGNLVEYPKQFTGIGGINQLYSGNSIRLLKGLSLGVNFSYLFGSITKSEIVSTNSYFNGISLEKIQHVNNLYIDYGLQYNFEIRGWRYSLGAIYGEKRMLETDADLVILSGNDSVHLEFDDETFYIPKKYGVGLSVEKIGLFRIGFDMETREWSDIKYANRYLKTRNSTRYSFGAEIFPFNNKYSEKQGVSFTLGGYTKETAMIINSIPINAGGLTVGIGIPIGRGLNMMRLSLEGGKYGSLKKGLILERFGMLHLVFTLHDTWFMKRKFD